MSPAMKNLELSVRQRLYNLRSERYADFQFLLTRYALERFLYRLSKSRYAERFVLKGALLFLIWTDAPHRPTKDLDLLCFGESSAHHLNKAITEICQTDVEQDGLAFDTSNIAISEIREDQEYEGQRIKLMVLLGNIRIPLQIDIAFGDVITPGSEKRKFPVLLELSPAYIQAYPKETVIAEKLQAAVRLGMQNSRMKDFYDLLWLSRLFTFDGGLLVEAIRATFKRRKTDLPENTPLFLTGDFAADHVKQVQWRAFLKKNGIEAMPEKLTIVMAELQEFLSTPLKIAAAGEQWSLHWAAGGPWKP